MMTGSMVRVGLARRCGWVLRGEIPRILRGCDVVLFPELVDGGYAALRRGAGHHRQGDRLLTSFARLTRRGGPACVAGSVLLEGTGGPTNTSCVFHRGRLVYRYDKIHLFRPAGDTRYFHRGDRIGTFRFPISPGGLRAGVILCYDLRFPELVRAMALRGLDVLFVPARWPRKRDLAWRALLRARAIENQIFVVGCNAPGREGGYSYVFGPLGEELFSSRGKAGRAYWSVRLPLGRLAESRRLHDNLRDAVLLKEVKRPRSRQKGRGTGRRRSAAG
jgi:predicted amidohydrolase